MHRDLPWFTEKIDSLIDMVTPDKKVVSSFIKNAGEALYYFDLQKKGFIFNDPST